MTNEFALEPTLPVGEIPERVISELMLVRQSAKDYAAAYGSAVDAQSDKYGVNAKALKRYIAARQDDKLQDLNAENDALAKLLET